MATKMSNKEYRDKPGLSASSIKAMAKSMAHYKYAIDHPQEDSEALLFGRAYHKYVLEPSDFSSEFMVIPKLNRRTKEGKEEYARLMLEADGRDIIDEETMQIIDDMRKVLYVTPFARKLLYGQHEESYFWTDKESGVPMKVRPDSFGRIGEQHFIVDLKTCTNAETEAFMKDAIKLNYDIQAAHYVDGMQTITGKDFIFLFIAQEKKPPYAVNVLQADNMFMESGRQTRRALIEMYCKCVEKNEWPAYMGFNDEAEINSLGIPNWLANQLASSDLEEGVLNE